MLEVFEQEGDTTVVRVRCPTCLSEDAVVVPTEGFKRWRNGALIQRALPELTADLRERLISGTCQPCWTLLCEEADES